MSWRTTLPLRGPGGEPVDFIRTINSHGVASLPPVFPHSDGIEITLATTRRPVTVRLGAGSGDLLIEGPGRAPAADLRDEVRRAVAHVLRLDDDLSEFYDLVADDPDLRWVVGGAGRMMRCQSVFEDVVKTICTTNCAWSATVRMVDALVSHLGEKAPGAPDDSARGRTFPDAHTMAAAADDFYSDVVRAGYRGPYLREIARRVVEGELDLEALARDRDMPDDELERRLLALPGVGPYAAAHIMLMLGRYSRLILDSWTRPTFFRVSGMRRAADSTIRRRFRRYGRYSGLAFWLYLTRSWVPDPAGDVGS